MSIIRKYKVEVPINQNAYGNTYIIKLHNCKKVDDLELKKSW